MKNIIISISMILSISFSIEAQEGNPFFEALAKSTGDYLLENKKGCISGNCKGGKGIFVFENDDKYEGEFVTGKINGIGIYKWADGGKYEGEWVDGDFEGRGRLTLTNGNVKEGIWKNDKFIRNQKVFENEEDQRKPSQQSNETSGIINYSNFDFYSSGNYKNIKSAIERIDSKYKSSTKLYSFHHKNYINCTWYGITKGGYAHGEGIGVYKYDSHEIFFIGNVLEGDLEGHVKYVIRVIHNGNYVYPEEAVHEGPMSNLMEGLFKSNVQEGVFLQRNCIVNDGYSNRANKWVTHYLNIVGDFSNGQFTKGVAYISKTNSLESFGIEGFKCAYNYQHKYIECDLDYATPLGKLERDKELRIVLGIAGAIGLIKGGFNGFKSAFGNSTDGDGYSSQSKSSNCIEEEKQHREDAYLAKDKNGNSIYIDVFKVDCGNGSTNYYYNLSSTKQLGLWNGNISKGYRKFDSNFNLRSSNDLGFLSSNKTEALEILCDCN